MAQRNRPPGASLLILLPCATKQPANCRNCSRRRGAHGWSDHAALARELLGDDPARIVDALKAAIRAGAAPADLGRSLAYAAALRVARFGNANEHADWETAHHVFTYANAVHQMLKRIGTAKIDGYVTVFAAYCTERWRSIWLAISMCRLRASRATAASDSTISCRCADDPRRLARRL